jgi:hypothetical protein
MFQKYFEIMKPGKESTRAVNLETTGIKVIQSVDDNLFLVDVGTELYILHFYTTAGTCFVDHFPADFPLVGFDLGTFYPGNYKPEVTQYEENFWDEMFSMAF